MIHEFAVEPEVMATWSHFRVLWDDFGVSRGRLLVEFPKEWRKRVHDLTHELSPIKGYAIRSKLSDRDQRLHRLVGPGGRSFPHPTDWQRSAVENQVGSRPFRAIVVRKTPANRPDVLVADELERDVEPWKVSTQDGACPRTAHEMLHRVETLLRHSNELVLVDPHFDPLEPGSPSRLRTLLASDRRGRDWNCTQSGRTHTIRKCRRGTTKEVWSSVSLLGRN